MLAPLAKDQWNFTTAAHLLNRAGFGGTPDEIERLREMGLVSAVAKLLDYEKIPDPVVPPSWAKPDPERARKLIEARRGGPEERRKLVQEHQQEQRQRMIELRHCGLAGWQLDRVRCRKR